MINEAMYARGAESSKIREIFTFACERKQQIGADKVFDFSLGNPSIPAPDSVRASIEASLASVPPGELHGYTAAPGAPQVRATIADSLNRRFGTSYQGVDVFMTVGAAASVSCALHALTTPGEEVIVVSPYFPEYKVWIETCGCTCVEVPAKPDTFRLSVGSILKAITPQTAAIIVNSPNNPTGAIYAREVLERLANILHEVNAEREQPIFLIADEPYRELTYGDEVPWIPSIYEHTVVCYSYSKSLSLAGERIGWVLVPPACHESARVMAAVAGSARALGFVCAPSLFQRVVADCVDEPTDVAAYDRNRRTLMNALGDMGYTFVAPQGAFYLWVRALEKDAEAFCERAKRYELLPVPSDSFGAPGWVRIGYCVSYETIVNSLPAWRALMESYR